MKIILPKTSVKIDSSGGPLFFLAGPVRGGGDWQKEAVRHLQEFLEKFYVAIPYYHHAKETFPLMDQGEPGESDVFARQLDWERHYIDFASRKGCLIFWLPEESKTNPRLPEEGPYATDTRGEIARASIELKYNPTNRISIGAEEKFPGLSQIRRNFWKDQEVDENAPFHRTLKHTVRGAVQTAFK